jgi:hypothetical protein
MNMSKFKIYRTISPDPGKTGRKNRLLYIVYTVAFSLLFLTINFYYKFEEKHFPLISYFSILILLIIITVFVFYRMKKQVRDLKPIGTIEFTKTSVKKVIGDLETSCTYDSILEIEAGKYLREMTVSVVKNGPSIYIIKIINKDNTQASFIVSNRSTDFRQKIGIIETLKAVRSLTGLKMILN